MAEAAVVWDEDAGFLPSQYADQRSRYRNLTPEHLLMLALVSQMKKDLRSFRHWRDAHVWFMAVDYTWPWSFASICDALNMRPKHLRKYARAWARRWQSLAQS